MKPEELGKEYPEDRASFDYYLFSRGYYFRPDAKGYTGIKAEAGLFTKEYAENYCLCDDVTMKHKDDENLIENVSEIFIVPMTKTMELLDEENARLRAELKAVYKILNDNAGD